MMFYSLRPFFYKQNIKPITSLRKNLTFQNIIFTYDSINRSFKFLKNTKEIQYHQCGYADCPTCKEYVDLKTHECYIQAGPKKKRSKVKINLVLHAP